MKEKGPMYGNEGGIRQARREACKTREEQGERHGGLVG